MPSDLFLVSRRLNRLSVSNGPCSHLCQGIYVVNRISNGVVHARLVFQVGSLFRRVVDPGARHLPVFADVVHVAFTRDSNDYRGRRVPAFFSQRVREVYLPINVEVNSSVVNNGELIPSSTFTMVRGQVRRSFRWFQVVGWRRKNEQVHRVGHASQAVTGVLLKGGRRVPIFVFCGFINHRHLTMDGNAGFYVFFSANFFHIFRRADIRVATTLRGQAVFLH